ncbi:hypothetical protein BDY24DRAFT_243216 [Mrakia frigida]|uniref:uncharacterized protein n=1 Tax=Mrakia frigida TaxID=29902 RepID=UPI003FCC0724
MMGGQALVSGEEAKRAHGFVSNRSPSLFFFSKPIRSFPSQLQQPKVLTSTIFTLLSIPEQFAPDKVNHGTRNKVEEEERFTSMLSSTSPSFLPPFNNSTLATSDPLVTPFRSLRSISASSRSPRLTLETSNLLLPLAGPANFLSWSSSTSSPSSSPFFFFSGPLLPSLQTQPLQKPRMTSLKASLLLLALAKKKTPVVSFASRTSRRHLSSLFLPSNDQHLRSLLL